MRFKEESEYYKELNRELEKQGNSCNIILIKPDKATINFNFSKALIEYFLNFKEGQNHDTLILPDGSNRMILSVEKININMISSKVLVDVRLS